MALIRILRQAGYLAIERNNSVHDPGAVDPMGELLLSLATHMELSATATQIATIVTYAGIAWARPCLPGLLSSIRPSRDRPLTPRAAAVAAPLFIFS